jgi:hypothetical protein
MEVAVLPPFVARLVRLSLLAGAVFQAGSGIRFSVLLEAREYASAEQSQSNARQLLDLYAERRFDEAITLLNGVRDFPQLSAEIVAAAAGAAPELPAALLLEVANGAFAANKTNDGDALIEAACVYARKLPKLTEFSLQWEMAALALLVADTDLSLPIRDKSALLKHLDHSRDRLPPGFEQLSLAIRQEQRAAAFLYSDSPGLTPQARSVNDYADKRFQQGKQTVVEAYRMMVAAHKFESVRGEAALRLAFLSLATDRTDEVSRWADEAMQTAHDAGSRYLIHLFRGRALQARGRSDEARADYKSASELVPTQTAFVALASTEFLAGSPEAADSIIRSLQRTPGIVRDPWSLYFSGAYREWPALVEALRKGLR